MREYKFKYRYQGKKGPIVPVRLNLDDTFNFECSKDLPCFTKCCYDAYIMLTPYDVIRLKNRLDLNSNDFLAIYTTLGFIENTELPIPVLKMLEDEDGNPCPFLDKENGCKIYEDRPSTCRYYPIGAGIFHNKDAASDENFFAIIKEEHCEGLNSKKIWTVRQWRENQGLEPYDEVNTGWVELILKRKSLGPFCQIPDKTLQMFFMGCYNVDEFRRFVLNSKFLEIYVIEPERVEKIKKDDIEALKLAFDWLKTTLFGEGILKIREITTDPDMVEVEP